MSTTGSPQKMAEEALGAAVLANLGAGGRRGAGSVPPREFDSGEECADPPSDDEDQDDEDEDEDKEVDETSLPRHKTTRQAVGARCDALASPPLKQLSVRVVDFAPLAVYESVLSSLVSGNSFPHASGARPFSVPFRVPGVPVRHCPASRCL